MAYMLTIRMCLDLKGTIHKPDSIFPIPENPCIMFASCFESAGNLYKEPLQKYCFNTSKIIIITTINEFIININCYITRIQKAGNGEFDA